MRGTKQTAPVHANPGLRRLLQIGGNDESDEADLEIPLPEIQIHVVEMPAAGRISHTVTTQRVDHQLEQLVRFDQFVDEAPDVLDMNIVIVRAVHEQQLAVKILGVLEQRVLFVSLQAFLLRLPQRFPPL